MNAKQIGFVVVAALFATSAFAGQPSGRDSVYAAAGTSFPSAHSTPAAVTGNGRGSVYASQLPAPTAKDQVKFVAAPRAGRA